MQKRKGGTAALEDYTEFGGLERVFRYGECDSTNTRAREYAAELLKKRGNETTAIGARLCAVFVAESQSAGRGRRGRSFLSPAGGIYASFLYFSGEGELDISSLTARTAVVSARAIERIHKVKIDIKWVNDLYVNDRKIAGILTEGEFDENGKLRYFVVGMGINVYKIDDFGQIMPIATTLEDEIDEHPKKEKILEELIRGMREELLCSDSAEMLGEYRERCNLIGRRVTVMRGDESYEAEVLSVGDDYTLEVRLDGGEVRALSSGEVSCRL